MNKDIKNACGDAPLVITLGPKVSVTLDFEGDRYLGIISASSEDRQFSSSTVAKE